MSTALSSSPTTADTLASFYRELLDEKVPEALAEHLVIDAVRRADGELIVRVSSSSVPPPTAHVLGGFYTELYDHGLPEPLAAALVIETARKFTAPLVIKPISGEVAA